MDDGPDKVMKTGRGRRGARRAPAGTTTPGIPLGTAEVSPLNQASAYATFANDGTYVADHVVKEVRDANGKVRLQGRARGEARGQRGRRRTT